jgi:hypothetical protein
MSAAQRTRTDHRRHPTQQLAVHHVDAQARGARCSVGLRVQRPVAAIGDHVDEVDLRVHVPAIGA